MAEQEERKTISLMEGYFMFAIVFLVDIVELISVALLAVPPVGAAFWPIKVLIGFGGWGIVQLWLTLKGVKGMWFLGASVVDWMTNLLAFDIPFGKTVGFGINWYVVNKVPVVAKLASAKSAVKGGGISKSTEKRRWGKIYPSPEENVGAGALPDAA